MRLYRDSTIFTAKLLKGHPKKTGDTFKVKIHVDVHSPWHVWSSKMVDDYAMLPLKVIVPDSLTNYFEITKLNELTEPTVRFDSNFQLLTKANYEPFDLIATVKVKHKLSASVPFYLYVRYQAVNPTQCMPPMTYEVPMTFLGQAPIKLRVADAMKPSQFQLAALNAPE
jgi:hypothetical protein